MFEQWRFRKGEDVFDVNDQKVGTVQDVGANHLDVSAGFLGLEHIFVPFNEISRVENDQIYLNVPKDQISSKGWEQKPAEYASGTGMYGTMPSTATTPGAPTGSLPQQLTGYTIYTSDNHEIGQVADEGPNYVHLQTGFLGLGGNMWIPRDCLDHCSIQNQRCYLSIPQDSVKDMNWHQSAQQSLANGCQGSVAGRSRGQATTGGYEQQTSGAQTMPLREQQLEAQKSRERAGEVQVTKGIEEQQKTFVVPVTHEEVRITEHPVNQPSEKPPTGEGEIRVPLQEETIHVEKQPRTYGEVEISKQPVTEEKTVTGTVRKEVPHVEEHGNVQGDVEKEGLQNDQQQRKA